MLSTVLDAGDTTVNKTDKVLAFCSLHSSRGRQVINKYIIHNTSKYVIYQMVLNAIAKKKKKNPVERDIECWEEGCFSI